MRLSILDWVACGVAGRDEPVARLLRDMVAEEGGAAQASLFGGGRAPARAAALVNGAASHALDFDDTHFAHIGHPSVAVLPATLAVAEMRGTGMAGFVAAGLAGAELSVRLGVLFGRGHYQIGFHQTATAGAFGATLAAGRLLGLDDTQMRQAMGLVSTRASGLKSQFGKMGKPYNAGIAAANGVEAALLAARGFVSNPDALEGQNGFLDTHHADGALPDDDRFLMEEVSHKFHACCHGLHAALEALERLKPLDVTAVERIEVTTHPRWMTVCNLTTPQTGLEAKFSYRAVMALSLLGHDTAALATYADALVTAPEVTALRDWVTVTVDERLAETASRVRVVTVAGTAEAAHDLMTPMSLEDRQARVTQKAAALIGTGPAAQLASLLESDASVSELTRFMA